LVNKKKALVKLIIGLSNINTLATFNWCKQIIYIVTDKGNELKLLHSLILLFVIFFRMQNYFACL